MYLNQYGACIGETALVSHLMMSDQAFIGYIQEPDVHDGIIINAKYRGNILRAIFNNRIVHVLLLTYDQRLFVIGFSKVRSASITNAEGMRLQSISEMYATPPFRRFVFVNSEEDSDRKLEVLAQEISSVELTEDYVSKDAIAHLRKLFPEKHR